MFRDLGFWLQGLQVYGSTGLQVYGWVSGLCGDSYAKLLEGGASELWLRIESPTLKPSKPETRDSFCIKYRVLKGRGFKGYVTQYSLIIPIAP